MGPSLFVYQSTNIPTVGYDWVGTVATAAVGLFGIGGSIWTSERQRTGQAQLQRSEKRQDQASQLRTERKAAYIRFVECIRDYDLMLSKWFGKNDDEVDVHIDEFSRTRGEFHRAHAEIRMLGAPDVVRTADAIAADEAVIMKCEPSTDHLFFSRELVASMVEAMRADLTENPAD